MKIQKYVVFKWIPDSEFDFFPFLFAVPTVKVLGDLEMYVKAGTAVTLRCLISNCLEEPAYVFWYHGDRRLLDDDDQIPGDLIQPTTPKPTTQSNKKRGKNRRRKLSKVIYKSNSCNFKIFTSVILR